MKAYEIKITLRDVTPAVWRALIVPEDIDLHELHRVFQTAMGWTDSHLHRFTIGKSEYADPEFELGDEVLNERKITLDEVAAQGHASFLYLYDFGDGWYHNVELRQIGTDHGRPSYCVDGARKCPPEDCGGAPGYLEVNQRWRNSTTRSRGRVRGIEKTFNPEEFDVDAINHALSRLRRNGPTLIR